MTLNSAQQIELLLKEKKRILITFRKDCSGDSISSSLALFLFLQKFGKRVDIVCDDFTLPKTMAFLRQANVIASAFGYLQKFIITVDVEKAGVKELSYDVQNKKLRIFVTPKQGFLTRENIHTAQSDFAYDCIIVLDTPNLFALGRLYENNTDFFYALPIINIDHAPDNEHFGQINLIDLPATSTAEVVLPLLSSLGAELIDEHIATALLTAVVSKTHGFKSETIRPSTLRAASELMNLGANREQIIHNLYRTRTISTLKLWGQALTHLQHWPRLHLVTTSITREDFTRTGATEHDLYDIVDELIGNAPEAKIIALFHEHSQGASEMIHVIVHASKGYKAKELIAAFKPDGNNDRASCILSSKTLTEAEKTIIAVIEKQIENFK